jgi:putative peptide zinc metalloprotease protein
LVLMAVELGFFIVRPVLREFKAWWQRRDAMRWNRASRRTLLALLALFVVLFWPWEMSVRAPGVLSALQAQGLYAPYAAQVVGPLPVQGQHVRAGQPLLQLRSPELAMRLAQARAQEDELQWQLSRQTFDERLMEAGPALRKRRDAAGAEVAGLTAEMARLSMAAPFDGTVVEVDEDAHAGSWIPAGERLLQLVGPRGTRVDAFVGESALSSLQAGQRAVFYPSAPEQSAVTCSIARIEAVQLASLDEPSIASPYGGTIAAERTPEGRLLPLQPTFRVRLAPCDRVLPPASELAGVAHLHGRRESLAMQALSWLVALGQREAAL